ncbi:MAG: peptidoglycan-binding domain-containing protein [Lachnospiraceae bacterium]
MKKIFSGLLTVILSLSLIVPVFAASGDTIVHITRTGSKYHSAGCGYLRSDIPVTLQDAVNSGYGACSRCSPPILTSQNTTTYSATQNNYYSNATSAATIQPSNYEENGQTVDQAAYQTLYQQALIEQQQAILAQQQLMLEYIRTAQIQAFLKQAGIYNGEITGITNEEFTQSLITFQTLLNLTSDGKINQEVLTVLGLQ